MRRVKALERQLGLTLFVRRRDGHRLTASGKRLQSLAQEAEHVLSSVETAAKRTDNDRNGRVRIATTEVGANWMLLPHLATFRRDYPQIVLEIDASPEPSDLLEDAETLALRFRRPEASPHVIKRLGFVPHALYATPEFASRLKVGATGGTKDSPYVGWTGAFSDISLARWMRTAFDGSAPSVLLTTFQGHIEAARQGAGAVGLPRFVGSRLADLEEVARAAPPFSLEAWLVVPSQVRSIGRIRAAVKFVEDAVRAALR